MTRKESLEIFDRNRKVENMKLMDLNVQEGDVVDWVGADAAYWDLPRLYTVGDNGCAYHEDGGYIGPSATDIVVVSRAEPQPKLWDDMSPEEKGVLLLAHHEGKDIQIFTREEGWYTFEYSVKWRAGAAYRVKPEPTVKEITLYADDDGATDSNSAKYYITLKLIDGIMESTANVVSKADV